MDDAREPDMTRADYAAWAFERCIMLAVAVCGTVIAWKVVDAAGILWQLQCHRGAG